MDLLLKLSLEAVQTGAEFLVSFKPGQVVLRHMDKALWVVEKTAKWAVPPPLDQDESAQQELVRPLPWIFFLTLLITLRVTRESISLINLILGKPPLRSADVVTFIQSKRRYLRTLKYQGTRQMRARATTHQDQQSWYPRLQKMFELSMCFKNSPTNNNVHGDNEEVMVVKRKRREAQSPREGMERLIEKMMVDLNTDTDDDSSFTLTNATSVKSDTDISETEQETIVSNDISGTPSPPPKQTYTSTPNKQETNTHTDANKQTPEQEKPSKIPKCNIANSKTEIQEEKQHVANSKLDHEEKKNGNDSGATDLNATGESFYEIQPEQVTEIPKSNDLSHKTKLANGRAVLPKKKERYQ